VEVRTDQNRNTGSTQRAVHSRPSSRESSLQLKRTQQVDTEDFILCGVVTATFRVLSLFVVMTCYSHSKTESVTTACNDDFLGISNKSIRQPKPASLITQTRDNTKASFNDKLQRELDKFPKYNMKILLGDFNVKLGREGIFKTTIWNWSLYKISNENGVRVVNFATSKNRIVKSTMFPYCNISTIKLNIF
jgi:hypothetical protein